ncbi:ABC transporter permease [Hydrogenophaga sp. A37]|uniref:ABC transporter permease n=1 Tax=Hydrogenophaga sp. A37 TaxID=1945864 RepID=UPI000986F391|nr:ABC transporter permease [Hydrogenophaga sp. A37]
MSASKGWRQSPAILDFTAGLKCWPIISFMALSDVRARYKRSVLGPLWLTLGTAIGSMGLGLLWSELMNVPAAQFVPTLTGGLILWQFIAGVLSESTTVYVRQASIIRNLSLPLSIYPPQLLLRHVVNLLHNLPIFLIVALVYGVPVSWASLLLLPALALLIANLYWICVVISVLGARFRDLEHIVGAVLPLLMFISPVFYRPNYLPFSERILWFNPLSHGIELVRSPMLGHAPPLFVIWVNLALLLGGSLLAFWLFNKKRDRIAFWI